MLNTKEESTTAPNYYNNVPTKPENNYYPNPDNNEIYDEYIPDDYYPEDYNYDEYYRPSQEYQENAEENGNEIVITIRLTERSLVLIIILAVVIFAGIVIVIITAKKRRDY